MGGGNGRAELVAQSPFHDLQAKLVKNQLAWTTDHYISFLRSQANGDLIAEEDAAKISQVLGTKATVLINNHIAVTLAFKQVPE